MKSAADKAQEAKRQIRVCNKRGLHARAAAKLVQVSSGYHSKITLKARGEMADGKSILGVLMLAAVKGTELTIIAEGADEDAALDALVAFVDGRFGEAE